MILTGEIDKQSSFFVGDAAGRKDDFSGTDRKWALNVDIPFRTPEVLSKIFDSCCDADLEERNIFSI